MSRFTPNKSHKEFGGFLILGGPLLFSILLLSIAALSIGAYLKEKTTAQAALDLSLVASAREICLYESCWSKVRQVALASLAQNLPGHDLSFVDLSAIDEKGHEVYKWEKDGNIIEIDRGRWLPGVGFETMEGEWQQLHPGISKEVVNFAIRLRLSFPVESIVERILPDSLQADIEGIATANLATDAWVIPYLALPVCALDKTRKGGICNSDRFFAGSDEFLEIDPRVPGKFLNLPMTDYNLKDEYHYNFAENFPLLFQYLNVDQKEDLLQSCFFPTPWFDDKYDNVGAIGAIGNHVVTESLIQSLAIGGTFVKARIGDTFSLLPGKATDPNTAKIIWNEIANTALGGITDATHRPLSEVTDLSGIVSNKNMLLSSLETQDKCLRQREAGQENLFRNPSTFLLSSLRSAFGFYDEFESRTTPEGGCPYDDSKFDVTQLTASIPLIAEDGEQDASCNGNAQELDPNKRYRVVGFVPIKLFDVGKRIRDIKTLQYSRGSVAETCSNISSSTQILDSLPQDLNPFQHTSATDGYVIRGRVDCNLRVTGSGTGGIDMNRPVISE